jgi:hypothetical protein
MFRLRRRDGGRRAGCGLAHGQPGGSGHDKDHPLPLSSPPPAGPIIDLAAVPFVLLLLDLHSDRIGILGEQPQLVPQQGIIPTLAHGAPKLSALPPILRS